MAISIDAITAAPVTTSAGLTQSHTTGAGAKKMIVAVGVRGWQTINSITYNGVGLTLIDEYGEPTDQERTALYGLDNPAAGAHDLVISLSASVDHGAVIYTLNGNSAIVLDGTPQHASTTTGATATVSLTDNSGAGGTIGICVVTSEDNVDPPPNLTPEADLTLTETRILSWAVAGAYELSPSANETFTVNKNGGVHETSAIVAAAFKEGTTTQVLRPSADSVVGAWTDQAGGTTLYAAIDEVTPSDTDYIRSPLSPATENGTRIKVSTGSTPQSGTRTLSWRIGKDQTGGDTINMKLQLRQGGGDSLGAGTLVEEFTRNNVDAATRYDETVTGSITNYADLYLEFYAVKA